MGMTDDAIQRYRATSRTSFRSHDKTGVSRADEFNHQALAGVGALLTERFGAGARKC
jgi:hypothetical protein